jgi:hypothetical protein
MSDDPIISVLARLEAGQARLQAGLTDMSGRIVGLEAGLTDVSGRLVGLEAGQSKLHTEMAVFRSGLMDELSKTRGAIMEKVEGLQDSLTAIHADIAINFGAVDQARRINDNTRDEMRGLNDIVARMMTLILRLQTEVAELKGRSGGQP